MDKTIWALTPAGEKFAQCDGVWYSPVLGRGLYGDEAGYVTWIPNRKHPTGWVLHIQVLSESRSAGWFGEMTQYHSMFCALEGGWCVPAPPEIVPVLDAMIRAFEDWTW